MYVEGIPIAAQLTPKNERNGMFSSPLLGNIADIDRNRSGDHMVAQLFAENGMS